VTLSVRCFPLGDSYKYPPRARDFVTPSVSLSCPANLPADDIIRLIADRDSRVLRAPHVLLISGSPGPVPSVASFLDAAEGALVDPAYCECRDYGEQEPPEGARHLWTAATDNRQSDLRSGSTPLSVPAGPGDVLTHRPSYGSEHLIFRPSPSTLISMYAEDDVAKPGVLGDCGFKIGYEDAWGWTEYSMSLLRERISFEAASTSGPVLRGEMCFVGHACPVDASDPAFAARLLWEAMFSEPLDGLHEGETHMFTEPLLEKLVEFLVGGRLSGGSEVANGLRLSHETDGGSASLALIAPESVLHHLNELALSYWLGRVK
jgi:hypothetical protein